MDIKKVLFVTTGLGTGGAEVFLCDLASQMVASGISCTIVSLKSKGQQADRLAKSGCEVVQIASQKPLDLLLLVPRLRTLIAKQKPDLVQGWMYHGNIAATLATLCMKIPIMWSLHHSLQDIHDEKPALQAAIYVSRMLSYLPHKIHYCATPSAQQHEDFGFNSEHRIVIPNGINCQKFTPSPDQRTRARQAMGIRKNDGLVIGHIGRLHPMKDHPNFIRAAALACAERPDLSFVMIGAEVEDRNKTLVTLCESLGVRNRIHLLGPREDIAELLHGINILSTSSAWGESLPIVIGEAMATGIPCVATDLGDCTHLIGNTGKIVLPRDAAALSKAWLELLSEPPQQFSQREDEARKRIVNYFEIHKIVKAFLEHYAELT